MTADDAPFVPVEPVRAYQRVAEQIEERILSGELPPGSRLPAERELVHQFAVGRSTVRHIATMEARAEEGFHTFGEADAMFHRAVSEATGNTLLGLCARAVHEAVVDIIEHKIATATDAASLMERSIAVHRQVLAAIRAGDGDLAARLGRQALYDYYAGYVDPGERRLLDAAVE